MARRVAGHVRTVGHLLADLLRPPPAPPAERWRGELRDPQAGRVEVSGELTRTGASSTLVLLVHGLGGSASSPYLVRAARVAREMGIDTLRLNLRGADPAAGDFYHGGLTAELHAALADDALAGYERMAVLGYSMGGHVALRYAAEVADRRVGGVAAVCAPLHLRPVAEEFDRPSRWLYRTWVLRHLRRCFRRLEQAGASLPRPMEEIERAGSFRQWDALTVVPRFGFTDPHDYYARVSAASTLYRLRVPCLLVVSEIDPVITPRAVEPYLPAHAEVGRLAADPARLRRRAAGQEGPAAFSVLWHPTAGHVAFPGRPDLERRVLGWLARS